jgi:hypothetical protein
MCETLNISRNITNNILINDEYYDINSYNQVIRDGKVAVVLAFGGFLSTMNIGTDIATNPIIVKAVLENRKLTKSEINQLKYKFIDEINWIGIHLTWVDTNQYITIREIDGMEYIEFTNIPNSVYKPIYLSNV